MLIKIYSRHLFLIELQQSFEGNNLRILIGFITSIFLPISAVAGVFAPDECEFSVQFPGQYELRKIFDHAGNEALLAKSPAGTEVKLHAECWPSAGLDPSVYSKGLVNKFTSRGWDVFGATIRDEPIGKVVTISASMRGDGDRFFLKFESFLGATSRFDISVLELAPFPSKSHLDFRNSVRKR